MTDRDTTLVYIGIGSNLDNPLRQVVSALRSVSHIPQTRLLKSSSWYRSSPLGPPGQADYINGVAAVETSLEPGQLLDELHKIEDLHDRQRTVHWGPRTLDLDLLLFGDRQLTTPELVIPHPQLPYRNFVLYPLAELDPDLVLPDEKPLSALLANVSSQGIVRLAED